MAATDRGGHGVAVRIRNLRKSYDGKTLAVNNVSFDVAPGELVTLLGPSGCGKTTILRSVAGLEMIDEGEIWIGNDLVSGPRRFVPPEKRGVGMIFQSYAIWPHMTVFDNVAFGLQLQKRPRAEIEDRVRAALDLVGLAGLEQRWGTQLSGGQQQRVALARSIVMHPRVLLFDEPLSNLDAVLRERMRFELRRLQKELGITAIYVTHDQAEAMAISDRIIVMNHGVIVQQGSPRDIYERPVDEFVAGFVGLSNFLQGEVIEAGSTGVVRLGEGASIMTELPPGVSAGEQVKLVVRPENVRLLSEPAPVNAWRVRVVDAVYLGSLVDLVVELAGQRVRVQASPEQYRSIRATGSEEWVWIAIDPANVRCLGAAAQAGEGAGR